MSRRRWKLAAGGAMLAVLIAACGGAEESAEMPAPAQEPAEAPEESPDEPAEEELDQWGAPLSLVEAAEAEGTLTLYSSQSDAMTDQTAAAFMEAYPNIQVVTLRLASGPLTARIAAEAESNVIVADVLVYAEDRLFVQHPEWFVPIDASELPNVAAWPDAFVFDNYVKTVAGTHIVTYNTDILSEDEVPSSWEDFLDPRWAGRALLLDPRSSITYMDWFRVMRETFGDDYLRQLGEQGFDLVDSGVAGSQQVAAGAYDFVFPNVMAHSKGLIAEGAPVAVGFLGAPSHGIEHHAGRFANSPSPNAGQLYLNWFLSQHAQEVNCDGVYASAHPDAVGCAPLPDDHLGAIFEIPDDEQDEILSLLGMS